MRYLVNRETKEHRVLPYNAAAPYAAVLCDQLTDGEWKVVEADAEGWIKWEGGECPLPDNCRHEVYTQKGRIYRDLYDGAVNRKHWLHTSGGLDIIAYRPILDKPEVIRPTASEYQSVADSILRDKRDRLYTADGVQVKPQAGDIISRLKSAHKAAQSIPDLLAELREALGSELLRMLVEGECYQSDMVSDPEGWKASEPDMSDWRNWKAGDYVTVHGDKGGYDPGTYKDGVAYKITNTDESGVDVDGYRFVKDEIERGELRFHSRPEVKS